MRDDNRLRMEEIVIDGSGKAMCSVDDDGKFVMVIVANDRQHVGRCLKALLDDCELACEGLPRARLQ